MICMKVQSDPRDCDSSFLVLLSRAFLDALRDTATWTKDRILGSSLVWAQEQHREAENKTVGLDSASDPP